jgi:hypothetical protein
MSIFGGIMNAIFGSKPAAAQPTPSSSPGAGSAAPSPSSASAQSQATPAQAGSGSAKSVDVEAVMNDLAGKSKEKLNWRTSIVDLMKLLKLDSSLSSRKELAKELGYSGSTEDSATMNIWLHKQVMKKLAENGGKVPADLH